jgi:tetratricopeptide (TPR) repeat protein
MKLPVFGFIALLFTVGFGVPRAVQGENAAPSTKEGLVAAAADRTAFALEIPIVEQELAKATGFNRDDSLVMFGRSSAASGRFDLAAAAYAMFLNEFGIDHPNSERIASRLADCLFPFKYDQIDVLHSASGPRLEPAWRMGYSPRPEYLRQAVHAFALAESLAQNANARGSALLKLGWVHRVLGDWDASTAVWDRCASDAAPTKSAADALWLAAENLEWTNRPAEGAERLKRMAKEYPQDDRAAAAVERVEYLQAEARRSAEWLSDPVASLKAEMQARASVRSPQEAYRSVVQWLQRRSERDALIAVSRWACDQDNWPVKERITCRYDLTDALLQKDDEGSRDEAVRQLQEIVELAPDDATAVHTAIRCCRILQGLERHDEAERMMEAIAERVKGSTQWEPVALTDLADMLVKRGETDRAVRVLNHLAASYPDYGVSERLEVLRNENRAEGGR